MSQCDRILAVLADQRWHTTPEIHERAGTMRLNSRISELRHRRGYIIDSLRRPPYGYRLISSPTQTLSEEGEPPRTADAAVVVSEATPSSLSADDASKAGRSSLPSRRPASGAPRYHQLPFKTEDGHRRGAA